MVGHEGNRPDGLVQTSRVKAINPNYPNLIFREFDVQPRSDGRPWMVGDEAGLYGSIWKDRGEAKVYAVITEVINASD